MPDGEDYAAFQALMLAAAHPKDREGRERLQGILDDVDRAIAVWRTGQE